MPPPPRNQFQRLKVTGGNLLGRWLDECMRCLACQPHRWLAASAAARMPPYLASCVTCHTLAYGLSARMDTAVNSS